MMKILIITQKIDRHDDVLGFFPRWVDEFARQCEYVTVICLEKGEYQNPHNVEVLSLGKEAGASRIKYVFNFYRFIWNKRKNYDTVFVHMNPVYVIFGGPLWKFMGKKIALWYTHKAVDLKLRIAEKFADIIFTAAKESFSLISKKVQIVGHGIDVAAFKSDKKKENGTIKILHVGRITPIKNIDTLIEAARHLKTSWSKSFQVMLVGNPVTAADKTYAHEISEMISGYKLDGIVQFMGSVPNYKVADFYREADCTVNLTPTGGIDKAVLESMAAGSPVFVSNSAFRSYFGEYAERLIFKERDGARLAQKIVAFFESPDQNKITDYLFEVVRTTAGIENLVKTLIKKLS